MKKVFILIAITFLFCSANAIDLATLAPSISKGEEPKIIVLQTGSFTASTSTCSIISDNGALLYTSSLKGTLSQTQIFDLNQLEEGDYTIQIEDELRKQIFSVTLGRDDVEIHNPTKIIYKPVVSELKEGYLDLNLLSLGQPTTVRLRDGDRILFSEKTENSPTIAKRFNLSSLAKGAYTLEVRVGAEAFYRTIRI